MRFVFFFPCLAACVLACLLNAPAAAAAPAGKEASVQSASPAAAPVPASETGAGVKDADTAQISDEQGLALAGKLLANGRKDEARKLYALLLQSRNPAYQFEAAFQLGRLYMHDGEYDKAAACYLAILNRNPNLARVRLELALAYFMDESYEDAQFQFELVKGDTSLPPEVIKRVDGFLESIRRKKNWNLSFGFSLMPDSNINQVTGQREECIATVYGLLCRDLGKKESGMGARVNLTANHFLRFTKDFGLRSTAGVYATDYSLDDYDDYIVYAASGPRWIFKSGELSLQPTFLKRWVGGREYSQGYGARLDWRQMFGSLILDAGASMARNTYDNKLYDAALRGNNIRFYLQPRYILTSRSFIQAGLEYTHDGARNDVYESDTWRYSLAGYYFFTYGFSLFVEGSVASAEYQAGQFYVTQDYRIDSATREDKIYGVDAVLSTNVFESWGITPMLQYSYIKRDSNIWSYDYDRHRINLAFNFKF
jgi:tetratricopeptide (TPR) repeat protein